MSELGDLLELVYGAGERWRTARLTVRDRQYPRRSREAIDRLNAELSHGGGTRMMVYGDLSGPEPESVEHVLRVWLDGDCAREEREGPYAFPELAVQDGRRWWHYSKAHGAVSNETEPDASAGVGEQALRLLEPAHVLAALRLEQVGETEVAGRAAVLVRGTPRRRDRDHAFQLFQLGPGADEYALAFDRERGVLLRITSVYDGEPLAETEVLEIGFDEDFPPETFRFELPPGESFRPLFARPEHVTLARAAELAPFTVLAPAEVPDGWRVHAIFLDAQDRPPQPPSVDLHYHSPDAGVQLHVRQTAADTADRHEWLAWEETDGVLVAGPSEPSGLEPGYARIERDGTRATLSSAELPRERLLALARSLAPVHPAR